MAQCPNCNAQVDAYASACGSCRASFEGPAAWKPIGFSAVTQQHTSSANAAFPYALAVAGVGIAQLFFGALTAALCWGGCAPSSYPLLVLLALLSLGSLYFAAKSASETPGASPLTAIVSALIWLPFSALSGFVLLAMVLRLIASAAKFVRESAL